MEKEQSLQQKGVGQLDIHKQKNEAGPLPHTTHKNGLKMHQRPKCKSQDYKTLRKKSRNKSLAPWI